MDVDQELQPSAPRTRVCFRVLGPLEASLGDRPVPLSGPLLRRLCCCLLIRAGSPIPAGDLADQLWGSAPPPAPAATLQSHIGRLRRAVGRDAIVTGPGTYAIDLAAVEIDAVAFEADLAAAAVLRTSGRPQEAAARLATALGRWRGSAFADVDGAPWAAAEIARLDELRGAALEQRLQALLDAGAAAEAVVDGEAALSAHRYREGLWASLLLALYRVGRQADALRGFQRCRTLLREELGIDPWPALVRLEQAILEQRPELDLAGSARPGPQVTRPPVRLAVALPGRLQRQLEGHLVGRSPELARLDELLKAALAGQARTAVISGPPGIGKTRLLAAVAAAGAAAGAAVAFGRGDEVDAAPYRAADEALRCLAAVTTADRAPGDGGTDQEGRAARIADALLVTASERSLVLVLDDLHWADSGTLHVIRRLAADAGAVRLLLVLAYRDTDLDGGPLVGTLAALRGEGGVEHVRLSGLGDEDVARLLERLGGAPLAPASRPAARKIASLTGGNPFLVQGLVGHLREKEAFAVDHGRLVVDDAALPTAAPDAVADVIARRLQLLGDRGAAVIQTAAVVGEEIGVDVVRAVSSLPEHDVVEVLDRACSIGLLRAGDRAGTYRFVHSLVRSTIYERLPAGRRSLLQRAASSLPAEGAAVRTAATATVHLRDERSANDRTVGALRATCTPA